MVGGGRGFGRNFGSRGGGFGRRAGVANNVYPAAQASSQPVTAQAPANEAMELEALRNQSQTIEATLSTIQKRIETLEKQSPDKGDSD